jgi:hypothetical protein
MKTTIRLFPIVLAFLSVTVAPQAHAVCRQGCDISNFNTFLGDDALVNNTTGTANTAVGWHALNSNTTGVNNTAVGTALGLNTSGNLNTGVGAGALAANTTGSTNVGCGIAALSNNTTGDSNAAVGGSALLHNTIGDANTAIGQSTLESNTTGGQNTAVGNGPLGNNTTGFYNTAVGAGALTANTTGSHNIAIGDFAGNTATAGNSNIDIGNSGAADDSGVIRIGTPGTHTATFVAGIRGVAITGAQPVGVDVNGKLGVRVSSARFKEAIKPMDKASEAIFSLQPVTFRYKNDPAALPQFGLVAEEVAKDNPDLVARDKEGKPFTVRYDEINAMLLNEFLKEHRKVQELEANAAKQQSNFAEQQKQIAALTAGLEKVSAQLELSKTAPQTVLNNR